MYKNRKKPKDQVFKTRITLEDLQKKSKMDFIKTRRVARVWSRR